VILGSLWAFCKSQLFVKCKQCHVTRIFIPAIDNAKSFQRQKHRIKSQQRNPSMPLYDKYGNIEHIFGVTYVENPLSQVVRLGRVEEAKKLITVTLPESCKKYDLKCGGKGHYLFHGVDHMYCNSFQMHNAFTLNYLGDDEEKRSKLSGELFEQRRRNPGAWAGSCAQKRWEEKEAQVVREKLLDQNGTFDFYPSCGFSPLVWCIQTGKLNRFEMAKMLLELGATVPQLYDHDPHNLDRLDSDARIAAIVALQEKGKYLERKQIGTLEKHTLLAMLRKDMSKDDMKRTIYQKHVVTDAVLKKGYSMEDSSLGWPLSTILENILPEIVDAYDPSTKLKRFHFD
jgi:hypothetical protein